MKGDFWFIDAFNIHFLTLYIIIYLNSHFHMSILKISFLFFVSKFCHFLFISSLFVLLLYMDAFVCVCVLLLKIYIQFSSNVHFTIHYNDRYILKCTHTRTPTHTCIHIFFTYSISPKSLNTNTSKNTNSVFHI